MNLTNIFDSHEICGIGQYSINLLLGLQETGLISHFNLVVSEFNEKYIRERFPEANILTARYPSALNKMPFKSDFLKHLYIDRRVIPKIHKSNGEEILFHPHCAQGSFIAKTGKTVVMLHDLFFKHFPDELSQKYIRYLENQYFRIINGADYLIVPSHFVKKDVIRFYPLVSEEKIKVIYNPVLVNNNCIKELKVDKPYILSVNAIRYHKNLITLIKAFELISNKITHSLVLAGPTVFGASGQILEYIRDKKIPRIHITGYISEGERNYLYKNASLFISPSLHEGFGITPVEAALFEIPVLTTRETSIPEVTKNLLQYYEPSTDFESLSKKITEILFQQTDSENLKLIKNELRHEYDFRRIAKEYFNFFQKIVR